MGINIISKKEREIKQQIKQKSNNINIKQNTLKDLTKKTKDTKTKQISTKNIKIFEGMTINTLAKQMSMKVEEVIQKLKEININIKIDQKIEYKLAILIVTK